MAEATGQALVNLINQLTPLAAIIDPGQRGFIAETGPPWGTATAAPASQSEFAVKIYLPPGSPPIRGAVINVNTGGATLTSGQNLLTLYSAAGVLTGQTADQSGVWTGTGNFAANFTGGPYTFPDPYCYVSVLSNGTTPASFRCVTSDVNWSNVSSGGLLSGVQMLSGRIGTTVTAPASFTPSALVNRGSLYWIGLY